MTGRTNARNVSNQNVGQSLFDRVTNAATGLFTATKKTRLTSCSGILDAVGADATYAIAIKRGATYTPIGAFVAVGANLISSFTGTMILEVGDVITNIGDAGSTNGTIDISANIEELG